MADDKKYEYSVNEVPPIGHLMLLAFQHVLLMVVSIGLPIIFTLSSRNTGIYGVFDNLFDAGLGYWLNYTAPAIALSWFRLFMSESLRSFLFKPFAFRGVDRRLAFDARPYYCRRVNRDVSCACHSKTQKYIPNIFVGLVVTLVGISLIQIAVTSFFGLTFQGDAINNIDIFIGAVSLLIMVFCNVWGKGFVKTYCLIIGMFLGWILALIIIPEYWQNILSVKDSPLFAMSQFNTLLNPITFHFNLIIPLIVIAIGSTLKTFGNLLAAQKISEPELDEVNFVPIRNGIVADGLATALSGLLGAMAVDTSSSNIGLAGATKVLSRWISVRCGNDFYSVCIFPYADKCPF